MTYSLNTHPNGYEVSWLQSFSLAITGAVYGMRHLEIANMEEPGKWGHRCIGLIQCMPGIGSLATAIELLFYWVFERFLAATIDSEALIRKYKIVIPHDCFSPKSSSIPSQHWEHIEHIHGNANLRSSRVVFLSDVHNDLVQNVYRTDLLQDLLQPGDVVLHEGTVSPLAQTLTKKRVAIQSWEDEALYKNSAALRKRSEEILKLLRSETNSNKRAQLDRRFWSLFQAVMEATESRNGAMVQRIQAHLLSNTGCIYVIAGTAHLNEVLLNQFKSLESTLFFKDSAKVALTNSQQDSHERILHIQCSASAVERFNITWFDIENGKTVVPGQKVKFKKTKLNILSSFSDPISKNMLQNPEGEYTVIRIDN